MVLESYIGENDLVELFSNLPLTVSLHHYYGVDFTNVYSLNATVHWKIWNRCMMGLKPSPYLTKQSMGWAEEFILGDYCDCDKTFQWSNIRLNFPVDYKYSPILPLASNINDE